VSSKRLFPFALAVVLATSVQAAHAAPLRALAELRAVKCCTHVCRHGRTTKSTARHCCQVAQDEPGIVAAAQGVAPAAEAAVLVLDLPAATLGTPRWTIIAGTTPLPRGAPIFLLTRTLRL
jgi:hypothetical protein